MEAIGKAVPVPQRDYKPPDVYRRTSAPQEAHCAYPGCREPKFGRRKDSRFCAEHRKSGYQTPRKKYSPASARAPATASVVPDKGNKPAASRMAAAKGTARTKVNGAGGRPSQPPAPALTLADAYRATLADLTTKRDALNAAITGLELVMKDGA